MSEQQPNIVLITGDHIRADHLGCAGHQIIQTPHIDQLSRNGVRFENAYSSTPICIPARASIMTGLEGHSLGLTEFRKGFELPVNETLPQLLKDEGYQTKVVGKMHVFPERCHYGFESMLLCEEGARFGDYLNENRGYDDYENWLAEQGYAGQAFSMEYLSTNTQPHLGISRTIYILLNGLEQMLVKKLNDVTGLDHCFYGRHLQHRIPL